MSMRPEILPLRSHGTVLGTRSLGTEVGQQIRSADPAAPALIVDFSGVRVASAPFLDEIACAMRAAIADHPNRFVLLADLNEDVAETLGLVVEKRDICLTRVDRGHELEILGGRKHLAETLAEARRLGQFTAPELAERLKLKLPNLHQRLTQLQAAGALTRADDPEARRGRRLLFQTPEVEDLVDRSC